MNTLFFIFLPRSTGTIYSGYYLTELYCLRDPADMITKATEMTMTGEDAADINRSRIFVGFSAVHSSDQAILVFSDFPSITCAKKLKK